MLSFNCKSYKVQIHIYYLNTNVQIALTPDNPMVACSKQSGHYPGSCTERPLICSWTVWWCCVGKESFSPAEPGWGPGRKAQWEEKSSELIHSDTDSPSLTPVACKRVTLIDNRQNSLPLSCILVFGSRENYNALCTLHSVACGCGSVRTVLFLIQHQSTLEGAGFIWGDKKTLFHKDNRSFYL